jgi:hypothetical protein
MGTSSRGTCWNAFAASDPAIPDGDPGAAAARLPANTLRETDRLVDESTKRSDF